MTVDIASIYLARFMMSRVHKFIENFYVSCSFMSVSFTGLDWNTTGLPFLVCLFLERSLHFKCLAMDDYNNNNSCLLRCFQHFGNVAIYTRNHSCLLRYWYNTIIGLIGRHCSTIDSSRTLCTLYYLWLNHVTDKIGQKKTNTTGTIWRLSLHIYN